MLCVLHNWDAGVNPQPRVDTYIHTLTDSCLKFLSFCLGNLRLLQKQSAGRRDVDPLQTYLNDFECPKDQEKEYEHFS